MEARTAYVLGFILLLVIGGVVAAVIFVDGEEEAESLPAELRSGFDSGTVIEENTGEVEEESVSEVDPPNVFRPKATDEDIDNFIKGLGLPTPFLGLSEDVVVESLVLARPTTYFFVDDNLYDAFREDISSEHLPHFLDDTFFIAGDGSKVYYTQEINFSDVYTLNKFQDDDYNETLNITGFNISKNEKMFDYIIDFEEFSKDSRDESVLRIFGRNYFVIEKREVSKHPLFMENPYRFRLFEGRNVSGAYPGYNISNYSVEFFDESRVKLTVNNLTSGLMESNSYFKAPGINIFLNEVLHSSEVSSVDLIVSPREITVLPNYLEYENAIVDDLEFVFVEEGDEYDYLIMTWEAGEKVFITEEKNAAIPFFENLEFAVSKAFKAPNNDRASNFTLNVYSYNITQTLETEVGGFEDPITGNVVLDESVTEEEEKGFLERLFG